MELSTETAQNTTSGNGWFQTTHWSVVLGAGEPSANGHAALSRLCETYWYPLYSYVRRAGQAPADAQDLTQGFFARLLEKDYLHAAAPGKGRFRSFLLMTLKRFMANEWDKANCQKRGGGREIISLNLQDTENQYRVEPIDEVTPEKLYNRCWAAALLDQVMAGLKQEFTAGGKERLFEELLPLLDGDDENFSYTEAAAQLGMTEGALRVAAHRLRQRYRELLRIEIANTVENPDDIDDEIRSLFGALT